MKKVDIEQVPALFMAGKISEKEAADIIWEEVYTHPKKYQLNCLDEDQRSDFLLHQYESFPELCKKFQIGRLPFSLFLRGVFFQHKFVFLKRCRDKTIEEQNIGMYMMGNLEERVTEGPEISFPINEDYSLQNLKLTPKKRLITETSLLILAMKFCHDLDDTLLNHISQYTKISVDKLLAVLNRMKTQTEKKREKFQKLKQRRDKSYFLHARYALQLRNPSYSKDQREKTKKRFDIQTRLWEKHNKRLTTRLISSPTNQEIGEELGITARQVSFYLHHIIKHQEQLLGKKLEKEDSQAETDRNETYGRKGLQGV